MSFRLRKLFKFILLSTCVLQLSCVENASTKRAKSADGASLTDSNGSGDGNGAGPSTGGNVIDGSVDFTNGRAELRHIVDPFDGTYKEKVTIPKNFTGFLYLSGLNITSLSDRIIKVRFNFGREMEPIVVPAAIGRAPGITPQTDIEVLILDMNSRPFENVRLLYDLYDYNTYETTAGGFQEDDVEFTSDPRSGGLYCRGLRIEHDSTFLDSSSNGLCDAADEKCNYAYAKVVDSGLVSGGIAINPSEPQIDLDGNGYTQDSSANALKKCLPDTGSGNENSAEAIINGTFQTALAYGANVTVDGNTYQYNGPYRAIASSDWEITGDAIVSSIDALNPVGTGLFQSLLTAGNVDSGQRSFLFPRAGKMSLNANVDYFGLNSHENTTRGDAATRLLASGDSQWMDGCNMRVTNHDEFTNEGISSCNVTATIELITPDLVNGGDLVIFPDPTLVNQDDKAASRVKLQLIRPSLTDFQGREVLYSAMKTCSNSNSCGSQECCFNSRCWSKDLVSQCLEDVPGEGNMGIGESCSSDFQCSSLCCNASTGSCAVHVNSNEQTVLCSKSPGQACVAKEWCRQENVPNCLKVKTGTTPTGQVTCALRCYNIPTFGECKNGTCEPPQVPDPDPFDPSDPNNCASAVDPPQI